MFRSLQNWISSKASIAYQWFSKANQQNESKQRASKTIGIENRRQPRLNTNILESATFQLGVTESDYVSVRAINVSAGGLGIAKSILPVEFLQKDQELLVRVTLHGEEVRAKAVCVYVGEDIVGYKFVGDSTDIKSFILNQFQLELESLEMKGPLRVSPDYMKEVPGDFRWFRSAQGYDLVYAIDAESVTYLSLNFLGNILIQKGREPARYGVEVDLVSKPSGVVGAAYPAGVYGGEALGKATQWYPEVPRNLQPLVQRFLHSIQNLAASDREILLARVNEIFR